MIFMTIFWWIFSDLSLSFSRHNDPQCHCNDFWIIILTIFWRLFFYHFWMILLIFFSFSRSNDPQCHCNDGFGGPDCSQPDVNECKYRPCSIHAECTNTLGSFTCACREGKKLIRRYYGNTGCCVFKWGVQNQKDFCLKISLQVVLKLNLSPQSCAKITLLELKWQFSGGQEWGSEGCHSH